MSNNDNGKAKAAKKYDPDKPKEYTALKTFTVGSGDKAKTYNKGDKVMLSDAAAQVCRDKHRIE